MPKKQKPDFTAILPPPWMAPSVEYKLLETINNAFSSVHSLHEQLVHIEAVLDRLRAEVGLLPEPVRSTLWRDLVVPPAKRRRSR